MFLAEYTEFNNSNNCKTERYKLHITRIALLFIIDSVPTNNTPNNIDAHRASLEYKPFPSSVTIYELQWNCSQLIIAVSDALLALIYRSGTRIMDQSCHLTHRTSKWTIERVNERVKTRQKEREKSHHLTICNRIESLHR